MQTKQVHGNLWAGGSWSGWLRGTDRSSCRLTGTKALKLLPSNAFRPLLPVVVASGAFDQDPFRSTVGIAIPGAPVTKFSHSLDSLNMIFINR
uniref:Uncharacterized protein n=1 Tax=Physcomitrium patens TaxID=3218 RepID=A0A2K1IWZ5_PHYPA|nr:hypothetical protein PHYPA_023607 [Physcomitrium patens]